MQSVVYRETFFSGSTKKRGLLDYAQDLRQREHSNLEWMEWCTDNIRRAYFDVDLHFSCEVNFEDICSRVLAFATELIHKETGYDVETVASASCWDFFEGDKVESIVSYHITMPFKMNRLENKELASRLNSNVKPFLTSLGLPNERLFDETVYKSGQGWRSINMSKPGEHRPMRLIKGSIEASLIQNTHNIPMFEIDPLDEGGLPISLPPSRTVYVSTGNAFMDFFDAALRRNELAILWKTKANDSRCWLDVIHTLAFESAKKSGSLAPNDQESKNLDALFRRFDAFSTETRTPGSCSVDYQIRAYTQKRGTLNVGYSQKIFGWVRGFNDQVYKELRGSKQPERTSDDQLRFVYERQFLEGVRPDQLMGDVIRTALDTMPITRFQYMCVLLFRMPILRPLLIGLFANATEKLVSLLMSMDEIDHAIFGSHRELNEKVASCVSDVPLVPYPEFEEPVFFIKEFVSVFGFLGLQSEIGTVVEQAKMVAVGESVFGSFRSCIMEYITSVISMHDRALFGDQIHVLQSIFQLYGDELRSMNRVKPLDRQDPWGRIEQIRSGERQWIFQYPYYQAIQSVCSERQGDSAKLFIARSCKHLFLSDFEWRLLANVSSDKSAAEVVFSMYPFFMNTPSGIVMFDESSGIWTTDEAVWARIISYYSVLLKRPTKDGWIKYGEDVSAINKVTASIKSVVPTSICRFLDMKNTSLRKLLYSNGIFHGESCTFAEAERIGDENKYCFMNTDILFFGRIDDDFLLIPESRAEQMEADMQDMRDALFYSIHGPEVGEYQLECLADALLGEPFKGFFINIGDPNSGKSTIKALIEASFGSYIGTGSIDQLSLIPNDSRDTGIANSMAYNNWYKRLMLFSEKAGQRKLDTEKIKQYASGQQDKVVTRIQHKSDIVVDIHFIMSFYVNTDIVVDKPDDAAYLDRYNAFYSDKSFVPAERLVDPTCQLIARPEVREWQHVKLRRQLFNLIFIRTYINRKQRGYRLPAPEKVSTPSNASRVGTSANMNDMENILSKFIIDGNPFCCVDYHTIDSALGGGGLRFARRFAHILESIGVENKVIDSKTKTENGKKIKRWYGLRERTPQELSFERPPLSDFDEWKYAMKKYNGCIPRDFYAKLYLRSVYHSALSSETTLPMEFSIPMGLSSSLHVSPLTVELEQMKEFDETFATEVSQFKQDCIRLGSHKRPRHD